MSQMQATSAEARPVEQSSWVGRATAFLYGILAYLMFFVTILYAICFVGGFVVPKTIDSGAAAPAVQAVIVNLLLMSLFAFFVSLVFAVLAKDDRREQVRLGALMFGGFLAAGIVLGWLMYPFPL